MVGPVVKRHPDDGWSLAAPRKVSRRLRCVLTTLADAILPANPRLDDTVEVVVQHALVSLQYMPRSSAATFLWAMRLLNWSPLWRLRGIRPLTRASRSEVRRHLNAVTRSRWLPVRLLMYGPVGLFLSTYYDQDYVHEAMNYDPRPFVEERIRHRQQLIEKDREKRQETDRRLPVVGS